MWPDSERELVKLENSQSGLRFDGKLIVVIGGSTGIGAATVRAFAGAGGRVVFTGLEDPAAIDPAEFGALCYRQLDVTDEAAVKGFAAGVKQAYGAPDVLFNNAGILLHNPLHLCTRREWDATMAVNVTGVFLCAKYFIVQMMEKGGGAIVNTASMSGLAADDNFFSYCASKGAVANMTRSMAVDYARYGIRVNAVAPGGTNTDMHRRYTDALGGEEAHRRGIELAYPMGRVAEPGEVAACVLFLASDAASFVTGHNLVVDGGLTAHTGSQRHWEEVNKLVAWEQGQPRE